MHQSTLCSPLSQFNSYKFSCKGCTLSPLWVMLCTSFMYKNFNRSVVKHHMSGSLCNEFYCVLEWIMARWSIFTFSFIIKWHQVIRKTFLCLLLNKLLCWSRGKWKISSSAYKLMVHWVKRLVRGSPLWVLRVFFHSRLSGIIEWNYIQVLKFKCSEWFYHIVFTGGLILLKVDFETGGHQRSYGYGGRCPQWISSAPPQVAPPPHKKIQIQHVM